MVSINHFKNVSETIYSYSRSSLKVPTMASIPNKMRVLIQPSLDSKDLILTSIDVPTPNPNSDEHLIRVHCVAPCGGELLWPKDFPPPAPRELIPCYDVAGTVITAPSHSPFNPGDEVYARTDYARPGCASDYAIAVTDELVLRPSRLSAAEATAVPLSSQTAWQALFVQSGVGAKDSPAWRGKRVLVTGASGGVGVWVTQLAKLAGATVIGTCGPDNIELVRSLGADEVRNYRSRSLREWAQDPGVKVDVVIDCVGRKSLEDAWWCVKDGGTVVSICHPPGQVRPEGCNVKDVKDIFFIMAPNQSQLELITVLVENGECRSFVDSIWPLEQFKEAFKRLDSGRPRGKIIIDLTLNQ